MIKGGCHVYSFRQNRFINVEENRRQSERIQVQHRAEFAQNHGVWQQGRVARPAAARPAPQHEREHEQSQMPRY